MKKSDFIFKDVNHLGLPVIDIDSEKILTGIEWSERLSYKVEDNFFWHMLDLVGNTAHTPRRYVHLTSKVIEEWPFPKYVKEILTIIHDKYGDIVLGVVY